MTTIAISPIHLSDADLLAEVKRLAESERQTTAKLIASLTELDKRRLYLAEGCASLFTYCTQVLHLSEHAAYGRIEAARAAKRHPILLELLADGSLTLTAVGLLAPHLTPENHHQALEAARHKSKREVEQLVASLHPRADVPASIRKLPTPRRASSPTLLAHRSPASTSQTGSAQPARTQALRPSVVSPIAPERYKVEFTVSRDTHDKLRRVQDLLRHQIPTGDPALIFDRALSVLLERLEKAKFAAAARPQGDAAVVTHSRHIPAAVKRGVWKRDDGRCGFVGSEGRCSETGFLEFHHVVPHAAGGETSIENIQLRCRAHNAHEAECYFGRRQPPLVRERRDAYA